MFSDRSEILSIGVLPANKTEEQKLRYVGRLLVELNEEKLIDRIGLKWILKDYNRSV